MTPLPAPNAAPVTAPALAGKANLSPRAAETAGQPSFEAIRQDVETTQAASSKEAAAAPTLILDMSAPAPLPDPGTVVPTIVPVPVAMPQVALAVAEAFPQAPATKPVGSLAMTSTVSPAAFFDDADVKTTDAADFAADLLAALGSANTPAPATEAKASARIDAPIPTEVLPELDMSSDAWLDQLARDITATASADNKLSFRIVPPQLGRLDINIEARDAGVAVHMKTETREAQAIVAAAQPRLENALGQNGIRVAETSVASNGQENLPKPHFIPQKALIEAVNEPEHEADTPTMGRAAGRFA